MTDTRTAFPGAVLTGPAIDWYRVACIIKGLEIEVKYGWKLARNMPTVTELRRQYGITARTKKDAIVQMQALKDSYELSLNA